MATRHNVFIRRLGDKAVIITITDWDDFKELASKSEHEYPDFLIGAVTTKSLNGIPSMSININAEIEDITLKCRGESINGICHLPIWAIKKVKTIMEQMGY